MGPDGGFITGSDILIDGGCRVPGLSQAGEHGFGVLLFVDRGRGRLECGELRRSQ
jgi:hypothetical protein